MIEWILQNREWIFSGIGITTLSIVIYFIKKKSSYPNLASGKNSINIQISGHSERVSIDTKQRKFPQSIHTGNNETTSKDTKLDNKEDNSFSLDGTNVQITPDSTRIESQKGKIELVIRKVEKLTESWIGLNSLKEKIENGRQLIAAIEEAILIINSEAIGLSNFKKGLVSFIEQRENDLKKKIEANRDDLQNLPEGVSDASTEIYIIKISLKKNQHEYKKQLVELHRVKEELLS